jgi:hypothetical protein
VRDISSTRGGERTNERSERGSLTCEIHQNARARAFRFVEKSRLLSRIWWWNVKSVLEHSKCVPFYSATIVNGSQYLSVLRNT